MADLRREHGRLIARLKRQLAKCERHGVDAARARKVDRTVRALIRVERRIEDPLAPAVEPAAEDVQARLTLMRRGAGLVLPR